MARRVIANFTQHEVDIIKMVAQEHSSAEIAKITCRSRRTIDGTRRIIYSKLKVKGVAGMVQRGIALGIIPFPVKNKNKSKKD